MRVAMAASEVAPFAKTGGLADVLGALPVSLAQLGVEASVILPNYGFIEHLHHGITPAGITLDVPVSGQHVFAQVFHTKIKDAVDVYLIGADRYFARPGLYGEGSDYVDNAERFTFFSRAVLALLQHLGTPDVLHCHDWQTGPALAFLRGDSGRYPGMQAAKTVFTIHNLGYQGRFWQQDWHLLNLDPRYFSPLYMEFYGDINFLKTGLVFADALTTVSPTYAQEIQTPELGHGLDGVLRARRQDLSGILNGIDDEEWNPTTDPHIAATYARRRRTGKAECKRSLQMEMGLPAEKTIPVIGMVSRLASQKGFDLLEASFAALMQRNVEVIVLGSGEARYQDFLRSQTVRYPEQVAVRIGFDNGLAHRIEAGSDLFLMPSQYEPCGLNQLYSLRYGTIPVVRATGGLQDSVVDPCEDQATATGFKFSAYEPQAMLACIDRSLTAYSQPKHWGRLLNNAMRSDFSWSTSARAYHELYCRLLGSA